MTPAITEWRITAPLHAWEDSAGKFNIWFKAGKNAPTGPNTVEYVTHCYVVERPILLLQDCEART